MRGIGARCFLCSVQEVLEEEVIIIQLITKKNLFQGWCSYLFQPGLLTLREICMKNRYSYTLQEEKIGYKWLFLSLYLVLRFAIDCYLSRLGNARHVGYTTFLSRLYMQPETAFKSWRIGFRTNSIRRQYFIRIKAIKGSSTPCIN